MEPSAFEADQGVISVADEEDVAPPEDDYEIGSATFVFDFVHIGAKFDAVIEQIEAEHGSWLGAAAQLALSSPSFIGRVGPGGILSKQVEITLGTVRTSNRALIVPISWASTSARFLFPKLDADLEFSEMDPGHVRIELRGTYRVPLGSFGKSMDKLIMHRMAESTVRSFLVQVAEELGKRIGAERD